MPDLISESYPARQFTAAEANAARELLNRCPALRPPAGKLTATQRTDLAKIFSLATEEIYQRNEMIFNLLCFCRLLIDAEAKARQVEGSLAEIQHRIATGQLIAMERVEAETTLRSPEEPQPAHPPLSGRFGRGTKTVEPAPPEEPAAETENAEALDLRERLRAEKDKWASRALNEQIKTKHLGAIVESLAISLAQAAKAIHELVFRPPGMPAADREDAEPED